MYIYIYIEAMMIYPAQQAEELGIMENQMETPELHRFLDLWGLWRSAAGDIGHIYGKPQF